MNQSQYDKLLEGINPDRVKQRSQAGKALSYLEAWDVKAQLIRIFGFGGFSTEVTNSHLVFEEKAIGKTGSELWSVAWAVTLRLTVYGLDLGDLSTPWNAPSYSETAVGSAALPQRGDAHDMAVKTAESDALKRCAINLGDQFGLSLYRNGSTSPIIVRTLDRQEPADA